MKMPKTPPDPDKIALQLRNDFGRFLKAYSTLSGPLVDGKYLHWDKLHSFSPPKGISHEEWWLGLKWQRRAMYKNVPLCDKKDRPFKHLVVDPIPERLHKIDQGAGGLIGMPDQIINPDTKDQYYVSSLIQEAITSL